MNYARHNLASERRLPGPTQKARAVLDARTAAHFRAVQRLLAALEPLTPNTYHLPPGFLRAVRVTHAELGLALRSFPEP
jgi:hypothetical protein